MPDYVPNLLLQVVMLYELDGWEGVEKYARDNGIPVNVCRNRNPATSPRSVPEQEMRYSCQDQQ